MGAPERVRGCTKPATAKTGTSKFAEVISTKVTAAKSAKMAATSKAASTAVRSSPR